MQIEAPEQRGTTEETRCANCGADVLGPYCHTCGQRYTSHIAPLKELLREAVDSVFNLDSRLWRTLKVLLIRPSDLTEAYLAGQRVRYVSPLRLYLIFSVLYFFVASAVGTTDFLFLTMKGDADIQEFAQMLPKMMFVIVPVFALLLQGLYRKKKRFYTAHLVFALHIHALWYILFTLLALLEPLAEPFEEREMLTLLSGAAVVLSELLKLMLFVYLFRGMRRLYDESRGKTFLKLLVLLVIYLTLLLSTIFVFLLVNNLF